MEKKNKLIIAIMIVNAIEILDIARVTFFTGLDLFLGNKNILVLADEKNEPTGGSVE